MNTLDQQDLKSQINHESIDQLNKLHTDFYHNFQAFKENLENREEMNWKYLRFRLDFNMYYQNRLAQEMGAGGDSDVDFDEEGDDDDFEDQGDEDEDEDLAEDPDDDDEDEG